MKLRDFFFILTHPQYWTPTLRKVSAEYDKDINEAITAFGINRIGEYTARVGDIEIWISNYPYSYGYVFAPTNLEPEFLPKAITRERIRKLVGSWNKYVNPWRQ